MIANKFASPSTSLFLALLSVFLLPVDSVEAVGLGKLTVYSTIGRPLAAEIDLTDAPSSDQPLIECFRLGTENGSPSSAPLITSGRITLEQSAGRYHLRISSEQPVNDSVVQLSLRKGCGAEVTKNYLFSVPAVKTRHLVDSERSLRLPRARQFADQTEESRDGTSTREIRLGRQTTARALARKRHPGHPRAQARYLRAMQTANPDIDLGSHGQNRLPAGTWLSIPGRGLRFADQAKPAGSGKHGRNEATAASKAANASKMADRVIVSSGRPVDENAPTRSQNPGLATDKTGNAAQPTSNGEARLLAAIDLQNEQQRLLNEKNRLLDERIQELQKSLALPTNPASNPPAPAASPTATATTTAVSPAVTLPAASTATAASVPNSTGLPATVTPKPRRIMQKTSSFWSDWGYELLFAALAAIGVLWLWRSRARRAIPEPAADTNKPTTTEIPSAETPETISRWQLVGESENLSVFDHSPVAAAKDSSVDAGQRAAPSAVPAGEQDEMNAVLELAEIMVSFGRLAGAAQAIEEFIDKHPLRAVAPWLKLLEIYRQNGQREAFDALGIRLQKYFNVAPAEWDSMNENTLNPFSTNDAQAIPIEQLLARLPTLGQLPHIQAEISRTWATRACSVYIDKLLRDNRNGERRGFLLGTVRELLLIADVLESRLKKS